MTHMFLVAWKPPPDCTVHKCAGIMQGIRGESITTESAERFADRGIVRNADPRGDGKREEVRL